ncbi:MAG: hypothetical protein WEE64_16590 [Dehalococcoidia bacterium]
MNAKAIAHRPVAWVITVALLLAALGTLLAFAMIPRADAHAPSGAIFTTLADGSEVNENQFPSKPDVYLDGGPGPGAPQGAAGLDDGTYVFMVTNPNGDVLLSTDLGGCRQVTVAGGVFTGVVPFGGCQHVTGNDTDHPPAKTVQLFPFDDTPNPGGVYKAHIVALDDFLAGCAALGAANGLNVVDCGLAPNNHHGFVSAHSKTDNFKVDDPAHEIDIRFFYDGDGNGRYNEDHDELLPNLQTSWTDTLGARNIRWSDPDYHTFGHVEAAETGRHSISIYNQAGCDIGQVSVTQWVGEGASSQVTTDKKLKKGPQNVSVTFSNRHETMPVTWYVDAACK